MITEQEILSDHLKIFRLGKFSKTNSFSEDVKIGLSSKNKFLLPKYFYDAKGSELFEKICGTKEYYPTRTEIQILKDLSGIISEKNSEKNLIVELGSGSSIKTHYLLNSFCNTRDRMHYAPIDVSDILIESSKALLTLYKNLLVTGIISFYEEGLDFITSRERDPKLIIFLGSSIGNFTPGESVEFMRMIKKYISSDDRLLIGFDMIKDVGILNDAYNDMEGFTAEFNLNVLRRINSELGGNFDLNKFEHEAFFNSEKNRIEMYLIAKENSEVEIKRTGIKVSFYKGEKIHTENSYKFKYDIINKLAEDAGLEFSDNYSDEKNYFSLCVFRLK